MNTWFPILTTTEFPSPWEAILHRDVGFYSSLSEEDRRELKSYIRWFLATKEFEGCEGLTVTDEMRVIVAAQACLLLLHRQTPCYQSLRLIRIYPGASFPISSQKDASGECWRQGIILLAWDAVRSGAANPFDGDNVVFHEFAHQLDNEESDTEGTPLLCRELPKVDAPGAYSAWAMMLSKEYDDFRRAIESGVKTILDAYGATDTAEFFAVATECFFEKPQQVRDKHPELYAALKSFYKQDPASWTTRIPRTSP
jgi:Mlc titration factor MtfA (ptsG expression regulator)